MEEKERFELFGEHCIKDNNPDARCQLLNAYVACVILNEQDKENQQLKQQLAEKDEEIEEVKNELKAKDKRIAELEEQLRNSRVKFFIGFDSDFNLAVKELDLNIVLPNWMHDKEFKFYDTKEEALAKLRELQEK